MLRALFRPFCLNSAWLVGVGLGAWNAPALARMDFSSTHGGILMGGGTYFHLLPHDNAFDPVPGITPDGTTIAGSKNTYLLPLRVGAFREFGGGTFLELYGRGMINRPIAWTASGLINGSGSTAFRSYGGGVNLGASLFTRYRFRILAAFNAEYVLQKAKLKLQSEAGPESLDVNTTSLLAGFGLQPELWLVDTWVLALFAGYQYGFNQYWAATEAASFFGVAQTGALKNSTNGGTELAQFGGFLVEATLKLSFY